jgi:hypothetical protein
VRKGNEGCGACCCFVSTVMEYNEACGGGNAIVRECLRVRRITVGGIVGFADRTPGGDDEEVFDPNGRHP